MQSIRNATSDPTTGQRHHGGSVKQNVEMNPSYSGLPHRPAKPTLLTTANYDAFLTTPDRCVRDQHFGGSSSKSGPLHTRQ